MENNNDLLARRRMYQMHLRVAQDRMARDDYNDNSVLHSALLSEDCKLDVIKPMMDNNALINAPNRVGDTPLHIAVKNLNSKLEIVEELLNRDASVFHKNEDINTPLHCAVSNINYNTSVIKALINKGAKLDVINGLCDCALESALRNPSCEVDLVKVLLENGANVNAKSQTTETAIFKYLQNRNCKRDVVEELLKNGADISGQGRLKQSVLHCALSLPNNYDILSALLENGGADINALNMNSTTVLHLALESKAVDEKIIALLLDYGAALYIGDKVKDLPLHKALYPMKYNMTVIQMLLESGALVCKSNECSLSPLGIVIKRYKRNPAIHEDCVKLLLKYAVKNTFEEYEYQNEPNFQGYNLDVTLCPDVKYTDYGHLSGFIDECSRELVRMRRDKITQYFSLFDFICNTKHIIRSVKLEDILTILCYNDYPIYKSLIVARLDESELLAKIHEQKLFTKYVPKIKNINLVVKVVLVPDCVSKIVDQLSKEDILNLILAYYEPINCSSMPFKRLNHELLSFDDVKRIKF